MDPRRTLREMLQSAPVARAAASPHGPRAAPLLTMPLNTDKNTHSTPSKCKGGVWKELYFLSLTREQLIPCLLGGVDAEFSDAVATLLTPSKNPKRIKTQTTKS